MRTRLPRPSSPWPAASAATATGASPTSCRWPAGGERQAGAAHLAGREGLKVPAKQPKRGSLWLADGSCIRLRPEHRNHVWAYDFVSETTHDGRKLRLLTVIDEYTRECLAIRVARHITSHDVLYTALRALPGVRHPRAHQKRQRPRVRRQGGPQWLANLGVTTLFIEPGSRGRTATSSRSTAS